ncbi:AMP-binding protein [Micromonospora sp. NPDC020750]|uniref:AMP-binding protein n=1 Tax=unclassified Micromonospora TaxID=2617518 RepID=UPI0037ABDD08
MDSPYALGDRIEQVVATRVRQRPDATAVQQGDRRVSYGELWAQASTAREAVRAGGVSAGDVVAVHMERTPERVAAFLGVLLAGAAYLPLDPRWPRDRVDGVVARSGVSLVVTDDEQRFAGTGLVSLSPDVFTGSPPRPVAPDAPTGRPGLDGAAPASVFYTSGSTGRPKGVLSPHRGTCRVLVNSPTIPLDSTTVLLQAVPVPWDMHSLELWGALLNGGRCVLMDRDQPALDAEALRAGIARGVNTLWVTSSLCNVFADECPELFRDIRVLVVGGDRVSAPHLRRILDAAPELHLVNLYGPAECSMAATTHVVTHADLVDGTDDVPIGRPVPQTGVVLLDGTGEIALSGDGLALGYLNDPDETARRFFDRDGVRYYRTGDRGELGPGGELRYRGRIDRQFKIRGVRIEPGEVEAVLRSYPSIASCAVLRVARRAGDAELACVFSSTDGRPVELAPLRDFAARTLLDAMIPTRFHQVGRLPLTPNGKLDQAELHRLVSHAPTGADGDAVDPLLAEVRDLLDLPEVTASDDLLAAGATSLDAIRLAARLTGRLGVRCTIADIYRRRSLAGIVDALDATAPRAATPLVPVAASGPAPLSHAQRRFWLAEQTAPGQADNMLVLAYLMTGTPHPDVLRQALTDVVRRNPVLRTSYGWDDDSPIQQVLDGDAVVLSVEEVALPAVATVQLAAEQATMDWWSRPFELEDEIPVRARICRLDEGRHLLCLHVHHVAFDGWSESVFLADLADAYAARLAGEDSPTPSGPVSYRDFTVWEQENLEHWGRTELPFWRDTLKGAPAPFLPRPSAVGEAPRRELELEVAAETVAALHRAAAANGGPPVSALITATGRAVATVFGVPDLFIGTVTAGRFDTETERIIGYFVNPLAVPVYDVPDSEPGTLLRAVSDSTVAALEHARIPFDELVRELRPDRSRHPFFQVWAVLQAETPPVTMGADVVVERVRVRPPTTAVELMFEAFPRPDGSWSLIMLWRADGMTEDTAVRLLAEMDDALHTLG